ncbi:MAG TPA: hypothetical protein VM536_08410 [Chloroflexia bacterium]|nr:hypothetical protein [Chloroflexia bacterium]
MAQHRDDDRLGWGVDRALRGFARVGAVAVAAVGFIGRTRRGRRAARSLDRRLARASGLLDHPGANRVANQAAGWLDRLVRKLLP